MIEFWARRSERLEGASRSACERVADSGDPVAVEGRGRQSSSHPRLSVRAVEEKGGDTTSMYACTQRQSAGRPHQCTQEFLYADNKPQALNIL
ncbi:MAG TPA: hypothetical protein VF458_18175 [Ktedonobacteraceae bacterium]